MIFEAEMTKSELIIFRAFLEKEINTFYEVSKTDSGKYCVRIFEMTAHEEDMVVNWLEQHIEE
jgi:hypothetical protein